MSDSDDDVPLAAKVGGQKLAGKTAVGSSRGAIGRQQQPMVKKEAPKPQPTKRAKIESSDKSASIVKVKKEYDLPGQTRETPDENDPLRKFYTTLLDQRPDSQMAKKWCVQHGLLPREQAEKWMKENKKALATKSPSKATARPPAQRKSTGGASTARKPLTGANKKQAPGPKRSSLKDISDDGWSSDDNEEVLPAKKKRASLPDVEKPGSIPKPPLIPRKQLQQPSKRKDVAFADGGLGSSDSDDDVPLLARKNVK